MALTPSAMVEPGMQAPEFNLTTTSGAAICLDDFNHAQALLIVFICNHCPFVKHIRHELTSLGQDYQQRGLGMVAINSNDVEAYPADDMAHMRQEVLDAGYTFPYALDETQQVAQAYGAACTPDFFLFNKYKHLVYRGQLDGSRPGNNIPVTGEDLRAAIELTLAGNTVSGDQKPGVGCSIKWRKSSQF